MNKNTEPSYIRTMFSAIAPRYDFLNRLLSLRQDVYWRRKMADALEVPEGGLVLDAACGTGDVMAELLDRKKKIRVAGIDFSEKMLALAKRKAEASGRDTFFLAAADVLLPPFAPNTFDAATIAFGIRNIADRKKALEIFSGLLRPGGMLAVLELATPSGKMMRKLYLAYFTKILPAIGGLFSKNIKAYRYLPASVIGFPAPQQFARLMSRAGFEDVKRLALTGGIATLYTGRKKAEQENGRFSIRS